MLVGSEIGAAVTALAPLGIDALGINCATGPELMHEHLRYLSRYSPLPILCQPNAGLPRVENDQAVYDLSPAALRDAHRTFVGEYGVALVGGCCGTTPAHMAAVVEGLRDAVPAARAPQPEPGVASLFTAVPYDQDASVLIVGERANANGSRRFKRLLEAGELRRDGQRRARPGRRGRAHRGRLRGLRRARRRAGHGAPDRRRPRPHDAADHARLDRGAGAGGRAQAARRQADPQLDQPGGRRRPPRPHAARGPALRRRRRGARHRRGRPGPAPPTASWRSRIASTTSRRGSTACPPRTSSSTPSRCPWDRARRSCATTGARRWRPCAGSRRNCRACTRFWA